MFQQKIPQIRTKIGHVLRVIVKTTVSAPFLTYNTITHKPTSPMMRICRITVNKDGLVTGKMYIHESRQSFSFT